MAQHSLPPLVDPRQHWPDAKRVVCAMSDFSAIPRGKVVDLDACLQEQGCRLSSALWGMTLSGEVSEAVLGPIVPSTFADMRLVADGSTLRAQAGRPQELSVICEPSGPLLTTASGRVIDAQDLSPRAALRRVIADWDRHGWRARVAPELEFFLLQPHDQVPGRWQAASPATHMHVREQACESNSLERLGYFNAFFDAVYAGAASLGIALTGHDHEAAYSQFEINLAPADPLSQADAVFRLKTLIKQCAAALGFVATFAPKPFDHEPGTGLHWHISAQRAAPWPHVFAHPDGTSTPELAHFAAGIQRHMDAAMALMAPHDASYRRILLADAAPTSARFGEEDRDLALRVPASGAAARRIENRVAGGDSNPYLVLAATMGLGLRGCQQAFGVMAEPPPFPTQLPQALSQLEQSAVLRDILGDVLVDAYVGLGRTEHQARNAHPHGPLAWDHQHLTESA